MYKAILVTSLILFITACGKTNTYCLEEKEANNYDYMIVTDMRVCDTRSDDVEYYSTSSILRKGDVAYVEYDGDHSSKKKKKTIKTVTKAPPYTPASPTKR